MMICRLLIVIAAAACIAACSNSIKLLGAADDGESFTGVAIGTGFADQSGTLQLVGDRGLSCVGTYVFEGLAGPKGRAVYNCSNGTGGTAALDMTARTGVGNVGDRRVNFRW